MNYWIGVVDFLYPYPENKYPTLAAAEAMRDRLLKRHGITKEQTIIFQAVDAGDAFRRVAEWARTGK